MNYSIDYIPPHGRCLFSWVLWRNGDTGSLLLGTLGSLSLLLGLSFYFNVPLGGPWTATGLLFGVSLFLVMLKQRRG